MTSIDIDFSEVKGLEVDLRRLAAHEAKRVTARTLTQIALNARDAARKEVAEEFELRRPRWTLGAIRAAGASRSKAVALQESRMGVMRIPDGDEHYLVKLATGGQLNASGGAGRRVTTARGSGEGDQAYPRRKNISRRFRPGSMDTGSKSKVRLRGKSTPGREAMVRVKMARKAGQKFTVLRMAGEDNVGVYQVMARSVRMVHRLYRRKLSVDATPWMQAAVTKAVSPIAVAVIWDKEFKRLMLRRKIFNRKRIRGSFSGAGVGG